MNYPLFNDPTDYTKVRRGSGATGFFKRRAEWQSLDACIAGLPDVRSVCDAPCGPGTLFGYWDRRGFRIVGVDLSAPMVLCASREIGRLADHSHAVRRGDVFSLPLLLAEEPDLVACVRFIYYFDEPDRVRLLQGLAAASRRYVIVQYKTADTLRGRIATRRPGREGQVFTYLTLSEIQHELSRAGLVSLRTIPISTFSERIFVLAEKARERGARPWEEPHPSQSAQLRWNEVMRHSRIRTAFLRCAGYLEKDAYTMSASVRSVLRRAKRSVSSAAVWAARWVAD